MFTTFDAEFVYNVTVELDHSSAAGPRVQAVDVLRYEKKIFYMLFQPGQCPMSGVGLSIGGLLSPRRVPALHEGRISTKCFLVGQVFGSIAIPEPARVPKRRKSTLYTDAGTREDANGVGIGQPIPEFIGCACIALG